MQVLCHTTVQVRGTLRQSMTHGDDAMTVTQYDYFTALGVCACVMCSTGSRLKTHLHTD